MQYQAITFVVTPAELEEAVQPFHFFINNAHVPIDYTETPKEKFLSEYEKMYELLSSGQKPEWKTHHEILNHYAVTTDITSVIYGREHMYEGQKYKSFIENKRGCSPYFAPFTFLVHVENKKVLVSTRASYLQFTDRIMGFELLFPKLNQYELEEYGVDSVQEFDTCRDYELLKRYIMKNTKCLKFLYNGIEKKTNIRISDNAKKNLVDFYCIKSQNVNVL